MITFLNFRSFPFSLGQVLLFLGMAGPVIWTINSSHTPLVSGWLWNTTMMLLKSDRAAGEEKQWGRVIIIIFFFVVPCECVFTCVNGSERGLSLCVWVFFFLSWQACASLICSFSVGIMRLCYRISRILFPHLDLHRGDTM